MSSDIIRLNVAARVPSTEAEGPGKRYALWVQGCPLRCPGCCNPHMLEDKDVEWLSVDDIADEVLSVPDIEGITFIGGEPFFQAEGLASLAQRVRAAGLSVMVFSGFTYEQIKSANRADYNQLLAEIDLLVDGPYIEKKRVHHRRWIGSDNQQVRFLTERYASLRDSERGWDEGSNTIELRLKNDQIFINGFPHPDLLALLTGEVKPKSKGN